MLKITTISKQQESQNKKVQIVRQAQPTRRIPCSCSSSCSCYFFIFCLLYFRREKIKAKEKKKEEAAATVTATDKEACRDEVVADELAAIKSAKEK